MYLIEKKNSLKFLHDLRTYPDLHSEAGSGSRAQIESGSMRIRIRNRYRTAGLTHVFPLYYLYLSLFLLNIFPLICVMYIT
jgi:hypothetical protein